MLVHRLRHAPKEAGPSGLCAAKTILQCNPDANVKIVDSVRIAHGRYDHSDIHTQHNSVGGVWAEEQLYPGLKTNNLRGTLDYTDFPMHDGFGVATGEHVTGEVMHRYLTAYAQEHGLLERIDFGVKVDEVAPLKEGGWKLQVNSPAYSTLQTRKLLVATGLTNVPHRPFIAGSGDFSAPILHSEALGREYPTLTKDPEVQTVAVIGGGKSAYDAVYMAVNAGHKVEWVIRKSGKGPEWIFPPHTFIGPFKARREVRYFA